MSRRSFGPVLIGWRNMFIRVIKVMIDDTWAPVTGASELFTNNEKDDAERSIVQATRNSVIVNAPD